MLQPMPTFHSSYIKVVSYAPKKMFPIWQSLSYITHCQKMVGNNCLRSWLTFSWSIISWNVSTQCSSFVVTGEFAKWKDYFWVSCRKLLRSTNTSKELNESQVMPYILFEKTFWRNSNPDFQWKQTLRRQKQQRCWNAMQNLKNIGIRLISWGQLKTSLGVW